MIYGYGRNFKALQAQFRSGGIIAYPTESCFGLGCDPRNYRAIIKLLRLKKRPRDKGLILVARELEDFKTWILTLPPNLTAQLQKKYHPPCTWLVPPGRLASRAVLGKHSQIAVRVTGHAQAARLSQDLNSPLISTSANRAGKRPLRTARAVKQAFGNQVTIVRGRVGKEKKPSVIRDLITHHTIRS